MPLPITDKFLLGIFETIQAMDRAYDFFAPRTIRQALLPELFQLRREYARKMEKRKFNSFLYHLKKKGYIKIAEKNGSKGVLLTLRGAQKALRLKLRSTDKKRRSDGKWLMIIFDIPEKKRMLRDMLRDTLLHLGYQKFQVSVWVSPYDIFKETQEFIEAYNLESFTKIFVIEEIE